MQGSTVARNQASDKEIVPRRYADFADEVFCDVTNRRGAGLVGGNFDDAGNGDAFAGNRTLRQMLRDETVKTQRFGENQCTADPYPPVIEKVSLKHGFAHGRATKHHRLGENEIGIMREVNVDHAAEPHPIEKNGFLR